ncbi:MAG: metal-dependent hydrolase [Candidatus Methanofastidiosia archaeon]
MPNWIIHYGASIGVCYLFSYKRERHKYALLGLLPDIDVLTTVVFLLTYYFLNPSRRIALLLLNVFGHRGLSHNLFSFTALTFFVFILKRNLRFCIFFFSLLNLHLFLDFISLWGITPLAPISQKVFTLNLIEINDGFLSLTLLLVILLSLISDRKKNFLKKNQKFINLVLVIFTTIGLLYLPTLFILKSIAIKNLTLSHEEMLPVEFLTYIYASDEEEYYKVVKLHLIYGVKNSEKVLKFEGFSAEKLIYIERVEEILKKNQRILTIQNPTFKLRESQNFTEIEVVDAGKIFDLRGTPWNSEILFRFFASNVRVYRREENFEFEITKLLDIPKPFKHKN